eukprot:369775_1
MEWCGLHYEFGGSNSGEMDVMFYDDESMAHKFLNEFNQLSAASNATEEKDEPFPFNSMNAQTDASWEDGFKQSDANATANGGSFGDIQWDFAAYLQEIQAQEDKLDNETTDNKPKKSEEDNMLKATFKPIVQLEEQKVDTGHYG